MTILKQNRISMIAGTAILTIALAFGGFSFASHSFEAGVSGDTIPDNTHILLNGVTLPPGGVLPVYDASPNYVSGHFLLTDGCVAVDDDTYRPRVNVIAGHIDELAANTHIEPMPLFYISHASNPAIDRCVFHAHLPDPLNGGAPRVTDVALVNPSTTDSITFAGQHIVDINIQSVLGNIGNVPYTHTVADFGPNPIYDLNDDEHDNDGLGHSSGGSGGH